MTRLKLMAQKPTQQGFSVYFAANPGHHQIFEAQEIRTMDTRIGRIGKSGYGWTF